MQTTEHHVEINSVPYRLAEDAEGQHYVRSKQSLRPPNAQIVQGEAGNKFNTRPDMLLWSWTDWSQGEGQLKFDPSQPGRSHILEGVNFFGRPGSVFLGYFSNQVSDSVGAAFLIRAGMTVVNNVLYAVGIGVGQDDYYEWDGTNRDRWQAGTSMAISNGARSEWDICGDNTAFYFVLYNTDSVYKVVPGGAVTHLNNQTGGSQACNMIELGDYLYKYDIDGKIYELSKTTANLATPEVPILDFSAQGGPDAMLGSLLVAGDNRVYAASVQGRNTIIYEIVPSSSAGTGFGRELARIPGMRLETMWWHGGYLFWSGSDSEPDATAGPNRAIYYYQPGGAWGTLGEVRSYELSQPIVQKYLASGASRLHTSAFSVPGTYDGRTGDQAALGLFEVDAVTGGFGQTGRGYAGLVTEQRALDLVFHDGVYIVSHFDEATGAIFQQTFFDTTKYYQGVGTVISPSHDFGITSEKVLNSIEILTDTLVADDVFTVYYSLDGGAWTALSPTHATDGEDGYIWAVSTSSSTKSFREMKVRVDIDGPASGATTPVLKAVNIRATLDEHVNVWELLLDCTDESSPRGWSGSKLIDALTSLTDNTVIALVDRYATRQSVHGSISATTANVVVDSMNVINSQPGEGIVAITLREVF